jgi:uncharacterized protein (TIGR00730 family)
MVGTHTPSEGPRSTKSECPQAVRRAMPTLSDKVVDSNTLSQRLAKEVDASQAALVDLGPSVAIFGSARITPDNPYYVAARETARLLSRSGIAVITGGGPGIMRAANEGAKAGRGGRSVGLSIRLPVEETANPHLDVQLNFDHFASRKVAFCRHSKAFLFFPGGFGTLDELGEVLTLIQCGKSPHAPVLLYDNTFWQGMLDWMRERMLGPGLIGAHDLDRLVFCNEPAEAVAALMRKNGTLRNIARGRHNSAGRMQ